MTERLAEFILERQPGEVVPLVIDGHSRVAVLDHVEKDEAGPVAAIWRPEDPRAATFMSSAGWLHIESNQYGCDLDTRSLVKNDS